MQSTFVSKRRDLEVLFNFCIHAMLKGISLKLFHRRYSFFGCGHGGLNIIDISPRNKEPIGERFGALRMSKFDIELAERLSTKLKEVPGIFFPRA